MAIYVYARAAIDFWPGWQTELAFKRDLYSSGMSRLWAEYEQFRENAYMIAVEVGFEGDVAKGPFVSGLPTAETDDDRNIMIAWKQSNNGDTFIASPFQLPWLEYGDYGRYVSE